MDMDTASVKAEMRLSLRRKLDAMSAEERRAGSARVRERLLASSYGGARTVLAYLAFGEEVDLDPLLAMWIDEGRTVAIPRMDWDANTMTPIRLDALTDVEMRRFGVREPAGSDVVAIEEIELALIPGMGFDDHGGRLGRGGGFYDRFLSELRRVSGAALVGLAFDEQIVPNVPIEEHDVTIDAVVTPTRWFCASGGTR